MALNNSQNKQEVLALKESLGQIHSEEFAQLIDQFCQQRLTAIGKGQTLYVEQLQTRMSKAQQGSDAEVLDDLQKHLHAKNLQVLAFKEMIKQNKKEIGRLWAEKGRLQGKIKQLIELLQKETGRKLTTESDCLIF